MKYSDIPIRLKETSGNSTISHKNKVLYFSWWNDVWVVYRKEKTKNVTLIETKNFKKAFKKLMK